MASVDAALCGIVDDDRERRRADYPYLAEGRKRPDPLPKLIEADRSC